MIKFKKSKALNFISKLSNYYGMAILLTLFVFSVFVVLEYKQNKAFKEAFYLNSTECINNSFNVFETPLNASECNKKLNMENITAKSNNLLFFALMFWASDLFIKDVWPHREKIKKFLDKYI